MSRGIGVKAKLILQDDKTVIYEYGLYNWNEEKYRNAEQVCDGIAPFMLFVLLRYQEEGNIPEYIGYDV